MPRAGDRHGDAVQLEAEVRRDGGERSASAARSGGGEPPTQAHRGGAGAGQPCSEGPALKKLLTPAARRQAVCHAGERWVLSERHACGLVGIARSSARYRTIRSGDEELRERLRELAGERRRFGYRRLYVMLRREGQMVNHKRVYRLYREEGLSVRKRKRRRVSREARLPLEAPSGPNQLWCLGFVQDTLSWGRKIRMLSVEDVFTREALAIEVDTSLPGTRVVQVLERVAAQAGAAPREIVMDNGPELTSRA